MTLVRTVALFTCAKMSWSVKKSWGMGKSKSTGHKIKESDHDVRVGRRAMWCRCSCWLTVSLCLCAGQSIRDKFRACTPSLTASTPSSTATASSWVLQSSSALWLRLMSNCNKHRFVFVHSPSTPSLPLLLLYFLSLFITSSLSFFIFFLYYSLTYY